MSAVDAETPALLVVDDVAKLARVDPATVRRWARAGQLTGHKLAGHQWRFLREDVHRFMFGDSPGA